MFHDLWRTEPDGMLSLESEDFRLTVQRFDESARFLVLRRLGRLTTRPYVVVASGTQGTVQGAMKAATESASRIAAASLDPPAPGRMS